MGRNIYMAVVAAALLLTSCELIRSALGGEGNGTDPAPDPTPDPDVEPAADTVMVTVVANSVPAGATVTGGGQVLGVTPLQKQVPIPSPQPGQPPAQFPFTFTKAGFQPVNVNKAPVNNVIAVNATLPAAGAPPPPDPNAGAEEGDPGGEEGDPGGEEGEGTSTMEGNELVVRSTGGGRLVDHSSASARAMVNQACLVDQMRVTVNGRHSYGGDLTIVIRGPNDVQQTLVASNVRRRTNPFRTYTVRRAKDQQAQGEWTVVVSDRIQDDSGVFTGFTLRIVCK